MQVLLSLLAELGKVTRPKFASLTYRNAEGELSRYTIMLGLTTTEVYKKDVETLRELLPSLEGLEKDAANELLRTLQESLDKGVGNNSKYTHGPSQGDTYLHIQGIDGVQIHKGTGHVYVRGYVHTKKVLEPVEYPIVNSSAETLAKARVSKNLRKDKFRTFKLANVQSARLNGETLELA